MGISTVRSPNNSRRADQGVGQMGGHIARHVGKGALTNPRLMRRDQQEPAVTPSPLNRPLPPTSRY
jgi:hypothetical protein